MDECIVAVKEGKLKGRIVVSYKGQKYFSFQGIPYAKPPLGNLRFKAPLPVECWKGIKDATKEGNNSISQNDKDGNLIGSEDCLYLNIYTPEIQNFKTKNLKPVIFWIHGGLFISGSGDLNIHNPEYLLAENIILITVNYRLGIFGFLSLEDSTLNVPGNAALKDLVMALNWVQNNVEYFGGDCNNVTIAGASAGAALVHFLILSPMTKGLFHRAIMQSGCALNPWALTKNNSKMIAKSLGCNDKDDKSILQMLQSFSSNKLLEIQNKLYSEMHSPYLCATPIFAPVIEKSCDGRAFLSEHPIDVLMSGKYNQVPIIMGYTSAEGMIIHLFKKNFDPDTFNEFQKIIPHYFNIDENSEFSEAIADKIKSYYYDNYVTSRSYGDNFIAMVTDVAVLFGLHNTISIMMQNSKQPIYFYRFSADTTLNFTKKISGLQYSGACHGDEISYLFKTNYNPVLEKDSVEELCVRRMTKLWCNFARHGNPNEKASNCFINIFWKPLLSGKFNFLNIDKNFTHSTINLDIERAQIWNEISAINKYESKY